MNCWVNWPSRSSSSPTLAATCRASSELLAAEEPLEAGELQAGGGQRRAHLVGVAAGRLLPAGEVLEIGQALAVARHGPRGLLDHAGDPAERVAAAVADLQVLLRRPRGRQGEPQPLQPGVEPPLAQEVEHRRPRRARPTTAASRISLPAPGDPLAVVLQDAQVVEQRLGGLEAGAVLVPVPRDRAAPGAFWSAIERSRVEAISGCTPSRNQGPEICAVEEPEHRGGGEQHAAEGDERRSGRSLLLPWRHRQGQFHEYSSRAGRPIEVAISRLITWLNDSGWSSTASETAPALPDFSAESAWENQRWASSCSAWEKGITRSRTSTLRAAGGGRRPRSSTSRASRHHSASRSNEGRVTRAARPEASIRVTM